MSDGKGPRNYFKAARRQEKQGLGRGSASERRGLRGGPGRNSAARRQDSEKGGQGFIHTSLTQ